MAAQRQQRQRDVAAFPRKQIALKRQPQGVEMDAAAAVELTRLWCRAHEKMSSLPRARHSLVASLRPFCFGSGFFPVSFIARPTAGLSCPRR
jgi:hypothetical protein